MFPSTKLNHMLLTRHQIVRQIDIRRGGSEDTHSFVGGHAGDDLGARCGVLEIASALDGGREET